MLTQTPWGPVEILDAHVHFFSPAFFESLAAQKLLVRKNAESVTEELGWEDSPSAEQLSDRWAAELHRNEIAGALLIASVPDDAHSVVTASRTHSDRFRAVCMANPKQFAGTNAEIANGVFLFPSMHHYSMHDEKVGELLTRVSELTNPMVYVHCGVLSIGFRKKLGLPSLFDMRYANPIDLHEVALRFPRINFVIPHFGAGFFREALMVASQCPNIYLDTSSSNAWIRYHYPETNLIGVFRKALEVLGGSRLLFGSDSSWFPRGYMKTVLEQQLEILHQIGAGEEPARLILGGNLRRLLNWNQ